MGSGKLDLRFTIQNLIQKPTVAQLFLWRYVPQSESGSIIE